MDDMFASRRQFLAGAASLPLLGLAEPALAQQSTTYYSALVNGYLPEYNIKFAERTDWRGSAGATWNYGMDHCVRFNADRTKARFELRNTSKDNTDGDEEGRRSELKGNMQRLYNNIYYWGAISFIHYPWADPVGMAELYGGVYGQLHMGDFGGSPAVAFRRHKSGQFLITTRGQYNTSNTKRYLQPLSWGVPHDLVYRVKFHEKLGELKVWLDGAKIVDITGQSIGSTKARYWWQFGCYFSGGITCPIVAEYGNHVNPQSAKELTSRIITPPAWGA